MSACQSFPPVCASDACVLILGSMPSAASLAAGQYYAHPQNAFWRIQCALWEVEFSAQMAYTEKIALLTSHKVALWDVLASCEREGSLDSDIRLTQCNDFGAVFSAARIAKVFCNGGTAHSFYVKKIQPSFLHIPVVRLPSTSSALTLPFSQKLEAWRAVRDAVDALA